MDTQGALGSYLIFMIKVLPTSRVWKVGLLYHFDQKFCIDIYPKVDPPDAMTKVLDCPKYSIKFKFCLRISGFSIAKRAGTKDHWVLVLFNHLK